MEKLSLSDLVEKNYEINFANGWFDKERPISADIALIHSEAAEAYEAYRNDDMDNFNEEIADVVIRCLDTAKRRGIDLEKEVLTKMKKNSTRGYRHGGKIE